MTDKQIELMKKCVDGLEFYSLSQEEQEMLLWLSRKGFSRLASNTADCAVYILTQDGEEFLDAKQREDEKAARDATEKTKDRRFNLMSSLLSAVLGSVVGALATLVVQKCFGII